MVTRRIRKREKLPERVSNLLRKAAGSNSEFNLPRDLLGIAFSNVGRVRRDVLNIVFQEVGHFVDEFAKNYTIKVKAEFNFERKKDKHKKT